MRRILGEVPVGRGKEGRKYWLEGGRKKILFWTELAQFGEFQASRMLG